MSVCAAQFIHYRELEKQSKTMMVKQVSGGGGGWWRHGYRNGNSYSQIVLRKSKKRNLASIPHSVSGSHCGRLCPHSSRDSVFDNISCASGNLLKFHRNVSVSLLLLLLLTDKLIRHEYFIHVLII